MTKLPYTDAELDALDTLSFAPPAIGPALTDAERDFCESTGGDLDLYTAIRDRIATTPRGSFSLSDWEDMQTVAEAEKENAANDGH